MSEHTFLVTVSVSGWESSRDQSEYAAQALRTAGLPDAARLDGYADLTGYADIIAVEPA